MEIKITQKKENNLLERTEMNGTITFTGPTPAYPQIKQALAQHLKIKEEVIAIKQVLTTFGTMSATFSANIYQTPEQLQKTEPKAKAKKDKKAEEKKA